MRAVSLVLITGLLSLGAAAAGASTINPNPISEVRGAGAPGGSLTADLSATDISNYTATFQLTVASGSITGIDIGMLLDSLSSPTSFNFVASAAFGTGSGIGGAASVGGGGTQAQFDFGSVIGAGESSLPLIVTFLSPIQDGFFGSVNFDNGYITTQSYQVAAPEPMTLVLLGLALGGLAVARRRASA
jgi:hypothetical protein